MQPMLNCAIAKPWSAALRYQPAAVAGSGRPVALPLANSHPRSFSAIALPPGAAAALSYHCMAWRGEGAGSCQLEEGRVAREGA